MTQPPSRMTIAYLANQFPNRFEPYVLDEIEELRRRGINVIACSARKPAHDLSHELGEVAASTTYLQPFSLRVWSRAAGLLWLRRQCIQTLVQRALGDRREPLLRRLKALVHTYLGACLAVRIEGCGVRHIHVHHGYFGSWVAMSAARLLGITYSLTLHGSDLLLHRAFLRLKLENCVAAFTVSEYNRSFVREQFPGLETKVKLRRLGTTAAPFRSVAPTEPDSPLVILSAGRLHAVKNYELLIAACAALKSRGTQVLCLIAGDGPERRRLQRRIRQLRLDNEVKLLGFVPRPALDRLFSMADLFVLTSRSEGIPVVLMEAMARGVPVIAPRITGIPELVIDGQTGFLYTPDSLPDLVGRIEMIRDTRSALRVLRMAARQHVQTLFNHDANLHAFGTDLLQIVSPEEIPHEDSVLQ